MHTRTEAGNESATETSSASDSESDDWSNTEDEDEDCDARANDSSSAELVPCLSVTCSADTFASILKFCAGNEIVGHFSSGALALPIIDTQFVLGNLHVLMNTGVLNSTPSIAFDECLAV